MKMKPYKDISISLYLCRKYRRWLLYILILIYSSCNDIHGDKRTSFTMVTDSTGTVTADSQKNLKEDSEILSLDSIEINEQSDSIKNEDKAFGRISFTMNKKEVNRLNKNRQQLGKYQYNFTYSFNGKGELFAVFILSDPEKAIHYEEGMDGKYTNLYSIISLKHGKPSGPKYIPSVFDVMNAGTLWINTWTIGDKKIKLGIRANDVDNYEVICKIVHIPMEKAENNRLYRLKNKNLLNAAEKY